VQFSNESLVFLILLADLQNEDSADEKIFSEQTKKIKNKIKNKFNIYGKKNNLL